MSANSPTALEGTQTPSQVELLWERYRNLFYVLAAVALAAIGANYAWAEYKRSKRDAAWSDFSSKLGMSTAYVDQSKMFESLADSLGSIDPASLESVAATAPSAQRPWLLLAVARRAVNDKRWERAEAALSELERAFPEHSLIKVSDYPVQAVELIKPSKDGLKPVEPNKKPDYKAAEKGSVVSLMRAQIAAAKSYAPPPQFGKVEPPADASKVKFELSGGYGSFVVALMPQAAKHREEFLKMAKDGYWKDLAIDEIRRSSKNRKNAQELHLGLESTRSVDDREKWTDTEASKHQLDFEDSGLSHFAGAVAARVGTDGKSCAERLWICVEDAPKYDGDRVVLGFVVEGLENLKRVCEAPMTAQEEEQGIGKPSEVIRVVSVTVL